MQLLLPVVTVLTATWPDIPAGEHAAPSPTSLAWNAPGGYRASSAWPVGSGAGENDLAFSEEAVTPGATPAKICFKLPATHTGVVGVTVAIVDKADPAWIVTHASYATPFNVTEGKVEQGCVLWNGLDENFWPVPPSTYGVKGIFTNVSLWEVDGKYHTLVPEVTGSVGPIPIDLAASPSNQTFFVSGDACGTPFSSIGLYWPQCKLRGPPGPL